MKKIVLISVFVMNLLQALAQKQTFDIVTYTAPKGWKKESKTGLITYSINDMQKGAWCVIALMQSSPSLGDINKDFEDDWQQLVVKPYTVTDAPETEQVQEAEGWKVKQGGAKFILDNANALAMLTTISGYDKRVAMITLTNTQDYIPDVEKLIGSLDLQKGTVVKNNNEANIVSNDLGPDNQQRKDGFAFTITNFDDGWASEVKPDWAEVSKPGIKILIHYPNKSTDEYLPDLKQGNNRAWNILVAPKYTGVTNFYDRGMQSFESITFLTANAIDKTTGKQVYVVLYKKHYYNGNGRYMEIVADNQSIFEKEFGNNYINTSSWDSDNQAKTWDKLANLRWRNKFAVGANDLIGKWSANAYGSLTYYYVATGNNAGTTATSTADAFTFLTGNNYQSQHSGASGMVGNMKFSSVTYKGKSTVTNWNITLTDRFQGATEKYDCYFEAVKGGRILMLTDRLGTTFSLAKSK